MFRTSAARQRGEEDTEGLSARPLPQKAVHRVLREGTEGTEEDKIGLVKAAFSVLSVPSL
jgi:hypothetical protein